MVLTQKFFDDLTLEFLQPTLANIKDLNLKLLDVTNGTINIDKNFDVNFNITEAHFSKLDFNGSLPLIQLGD